MGIGCDVHWVLTIPIVERIGPQLLWRAIVAPAVTSHGTLTYLRCGRYFPYDEKSRAAGTSWTIYKIAARQILIGTAEVGDETEAMEKGQLRPADDPCGGLRHQR